MPIADNIVITRANFDDGVTDLASPFFNRVIERASELGYNIDDLHGDDDTRANFEASIQSNDPAFFTGMGHGLYDRFAGQYNEILIKSGVNDHLMKDRTVYLLSCQTGARLGKTIMGKGGTAFLGYKKDYFFCGWVPGDEYTEAFEDCSNIIPITLFEGGTPDEAYNAALNKYAQWIEYWMTSEDPLAPFVLSALIHDRNALVTYPTMLEPSPMPLMVVAGVLIMGLIAK